MGDKVTLVSSAEETAKDLYRALIEKDLLNESGNPTHTFIATGDTDSFSSLARRFLGPEVHSVEGKI
jgi:glutamate racemase